MDSSVTPNTDNNEPKFFCKVHGKPILRLNLKSENQKFKLLCEQCLEELDSIRSSKADSVSSFITPENYKIFDNKIIQFKDFQQKKIKEVRKCLSSVEDVFDDLVVSLHRRKKNLKDLLKTEIDHQNEVYSQVDITYQKYQKNFQILLAGNSSEEALNECLKLFSELEKKTNAKNSIENDAADSKRLIELFTNTSNILTQTYKSLEEMFEKFIGQNLTPTPQTDRPSHHTRELSPLKNVTPRQYARSNIKSKSSLSPSPSIPRESLATQRSVISPMRPNKPATTNMNNSLSISPLRPVSHSSALLRSIVNRSSSIPKKDSPQSNVHNSAAQVMLPSVNQSLRYGNRYEPNGPESNVVVFDDEILRSGRKTVDTAISSHKLETKMKSVDTMTYIVEKQILVYGGQLRGDQHTSLVFYRLDGSPKILKTATAHSQQITSLTYTSGKLFSSSKDSQVKVWDVESYYPQLILKHNSAVLGVVFYANKNIVFTHGSFLDIRVWDLNDLSDKYIKVRGASDITRLHFVESREWLIASNGQDGSIHIVDYRAESTIIELAGQSQMGYDDMEFDTEKNRLLTVACDGIVKIWNFETDSPFLEKTIPFKYKGGYTSVNSLVVDFKEDLLFLTNSRNMFWVGKISQGCMLGFLNWLEVDVKNIHKIIYVKKRQWILAANKNNGKIAIVNLKELKKTALEPLS